MTRRRTSTVRDANNPAGTVNDAKLLSREHACEWVLTYLKDRRHRLGEGPAPTRTSVLKIAQIIGFQSATHLPIVIDAQKFPKSSGYPERPRLHRRDCAIV
jgi:hypothetical protein